jgi:acyl carrier protein
MDTDQAKRIIDQALAKTLKRDHVDWSADSDLLGDEILDSLDCVVFTLQVQELSGVELPPEALAQPDAYRVGNIIQLLTGSAT